MHFKHPFFRKFFYSLRNQRANFFAGNHFQ